MMAQHLNKKPTGDDFRYFEGPGMCYIGVRQLPRGYIAFFVADIGDGDEEPGVEALEC